MLHGQIIPVRIRTEIGNTVQAEGQACLLYTSDMEDFLDYPFPDYAHGNNSHQKKQVEEIKKRDLIALGDMQTTIWETAWYLRGMENLFCDCILYTSRCV